MPALPQVVNQQTISYQNIRVGDGNPNNIEQYGEPGWIYQDWSGGALYVCTVAGIAGWVLSSSGGQPSNPLFDASGNPSVDFYNRNLFAFGGGSASIDWGNGELKSIDSGNTTVNWNDAVLKDLSGQYSVDWSDWKLYKDNSTKTLDWRNCKLFDGNVIEAVDWTDRQMRNSSGAVTVDWADCYLRDANKNPSLGWNDRVLQSTSNVTTVDWESNSLWTSSDEWSLNWGSRYLYDVAGHTCVQWGNRVLTESNFGYQTLNWETGVLIDYNYGEPKSSLNWKTRILYAFEPFPAETETTSINWDTRKLFNNASVESLDWQSGHLTGQWQTVTTGKTSGNLMSNATYLPTNTSGNYNPSPAPANAGMVIYHVASTNALIASLTLALQGGSSAIVSVPIGGDISFTSRYGITTLTVTSGGFTLLGTPVTTCPAGTTITFRKLSSTILARLT
jgi:hypothetical protein